MRRTALFLAALFMTFPVFAQDAAPVPAPTPPPVLKQPIACTIGQNCWIIHYPNAAAAGNEPKDFKCGTMTYADSIGTGIALRDAKEMDAGVNVLAAADGRIMNVRNGIDDTAPSDDDIKKLRADKKACGNAVLIDHGKGWQSIYCHLKKDSIKIKKGDAVKAGAIIAQAGQSGDAEIPQMHFGLFHDGKTVDPFTGLETGNGCGEEGKPLWSQELGITYQPLSLYAAGFAKGAPDIAGLKNEILSQDLGSPQTMDNKDLPGLSFWAGILGAAPGDHITLELVRPDGTPFARKEFTQGENRTRQFYYIGRDLQKPGQSPSPLDPGFYTGTATITRKGPDGNLLTRTITRTLALGSAGGFAGPGETSAPMPAQ